MISLPLLFPENFGNYNLTLTALREFDRLPAMKRVSIIVLIMLFSAVCAPLTIAASPYDHESCLVTLDVCNASHGALSVNADSPAIQTCFSHMFPLAFSGYVDMLDPLFKPAVFTFTHERPPIV
jgi:hypothetical protein